MNTGLLRPAVATVLTVYGIETFHALRSRMEMQLQQYLPFTVLKRHICLHGLEAQLSLVATVLTVYGIETYSRLNE